MARKGGRVLLGFEDEIITEKHKSFVNFTTNKIGGKPDWPCDGIPTPSCQLCGLVLPLIVQIYAPLENSPYHRTLYIFGCINPNCWNQSESWICVRSQTVDTASDPGVASPAVTVNTGTTTDWCQEADDWDDDNNVNNNEENGNVIACIKNVESCEHVSDDDNEMEDNQCDLRMQLGNLNLDERNANCGELKGGAGIQEGGAVGCLISPAATAEIEGDEGEVVSIDTPTAPQHDLIALLQETAPLPAVLRNSSEASGQRMPSSCSLEFAPYFISVDEENLGGSPSITPLSEHVRELLQEYQQNSEEGSFSPEQEKMVSMGQGDQLTQEKYEKSIPAHGDKMFHQFLLRIQRNPGQIIRYCREGGGPLLLQPVNESPARCSHCLGDMMFELQLLPTLIPRLRLTVACSGEGVSSSSHVEYGTVLIFTCRRSCWSAGDSFRNERIIVQSENVI
ncbi:programmed cell death protein 2-like [Schistocerca piceifrons]|uniref:programmed cell death protein 2-like n=1 Tax=Schistocerca piceifrons TaxID=274613 RepID=UPI001F5FE040|nr:programmed cell death protein 2-like [Schistocerca piceifrons]